ncbi:hypothetical protein QTO34_012702 [Cnephaeus nilssonii]|uniref:Uncharacterized protein n=1 Tax=Cnephaeus nilssonii TaxID=3371016 RepID=A0AA40LD82_CNENI|nr:hypothetical protein QTO34_012702 [Eptesicus nilssonii]
MKSGKARQRLGLPFSLLVFGGRPRAQIWGLDQGSSAVWGQTSRSRRPLSGAETKEVYERADPELLVLEEYLTVPPQGTQIWVRQNTQEVERRQWLEDLQNPEDGGCR